MKQENIAKDAESAGSLFSVLQSVGRSASMFVNCYLFYNIVIVYAVELYMYIISL